MTYEGEEPIEVDGYQVVAFKESGEWTIPAGVTEIDVLVVAGGGGGGGANIDWTARTGGGGGAGGLISIEGYDISKYGGEISVTVGNGGSRGTYDDGSSPGSNGEDSVFGDLTAIGGGAGGGSTSQDGLSGGSGGAGGGNSNTGSGGGSGGAGTQPSTNDGYENSGFGNDGYSVGGYEGGGGGGGAGSAGARNAGGDGLTVFGETYAMGGAHGRASYHTPDPNTGSGGKGGSSEDNQNADGASGVVIIRYIAPVISNPSPSDGTRVPETSSVTLSVDVTHADGDSMDVSFYDASEDTLIGTTQTDISDGGTASVDWTGLSSGTTCSWYAVADDGTVTTQSPNYSFTINTPPTVDNPSPSDNATGLYTNVILSVDVSDSDGDSMDVSFYDASDDSKIGTTQTNISDGGTASVTWTNLTLPNTYSWYAIADDSYDTRQSATYSFTTAPFVEFKDLNTIRSGVNTNLTLELDHNFNRLFNSAKILATDRDVTPTGTVSPILVANTDTSSRFNNNFTYTYNNLNNANKNIVSAITSATFPSGSAEQFPRFKNDVGREEVITFTDSGTWTVPAGVTNVDVLVVAGGGGGGASFSNSPRYGGGGGAGGVIYEENYSVSEQENINIVVGAGGLGSDDRHSNPHRVRGDDGENSSFGSLTAIGGGGGSSSSSEDVDEDPAGDGGSGGGGGGGAFSVGAGGSGTLNQGHDGADGSSSFSGGGGGAGSAGDETTGGLGFTFLETTYGKGGDGKTGSTQTHGANAADNTGDGGEGSSGNGGTGYGGNGGSGIVIIRYVSDDLDFNTNTYTSGVDTSLRTKLTTDFNNLDNASENLLKYYGLKLKYDDDDSPVEDNTVRTRLTPTVSTQVVSGVEDINWSSLIPGATSVFCVEYNNNKETGTVTVGYNTSTGKGIALLNLNDLSVQNKIHILNENLPNVGSSYSGRRFKVAWSENYEKAVFVEHGYRVENQRVYVIYAAKVYSSTGSELASTSSEFFDRGYYAISISDVGYFSDEESLYFNETGNTLRIYEIINMLGEATSGGYQRPGIVINQVSINLETNTISRDSVLDIQHSTAGSYQSSSHNGWSWMSGDTIYLLNVYGRRNSGWELHNHYYYYSINTETGTVTTLVDGVRVNSPSGVICNATVYGPHLDTIVWADRARDEPTTDQLWATFNAGYTNDTQYFYQRPSDSDPEDGYTFSTAVRYYKDGLDIYMNQVSRNNTYTLAFNEYSIIPPTTFVDDRTHYMTLYRNSPIKRYFIKDNKIMGYNVSSSALSPYYKQTGAVTRTVSPTKTGTIGAVSAVLTNTNFEDSYNSTHQSTEYDGVTYRNVCWLRIPDATKNIKHFQSVDGFMPTHADTQPVFRFEEE